MTSRRMIRGELAQNGVPEWEPLRAVAGDEVLDAFMWMHAVRLRDGRLFAGIALDLAQLCPRDDVDFRAMWAVVERLERVVERTTAAELGRASSASRA
jgi:hypothetical protein